jgi:phage tail-like protein
MISYFDTQPVAFYFTVKFAAAFGITDTSFKEVSGISKEILTSEFTQGGEPGYVYKIPKGFKYPRLVMKRGIAPLSSPLVVWCKSILDSTNLDSFSCMPIMVYLMDEKQMPIRGWSFINAFPVKWEVESFGSLKNEVAIESIEFEYQHFSRIM